MHLPTHADVVDAARAIAGVAVRTPLVTSPALDALTGGRVFLKAECLQRTGSFKFRGAYNRLSRLNETERKAGVVAMSSGNHAQGVATAAQMLGMPATIVMPHDSPALKQARTRAAGARIVPYDRVKDDRTAMARAIAAETGATLVPPYDDFHIIAGQGTSGLEATADLAALGLAPDVALVCCSGGGLMAGVTLAVHAVNANAALYTVEPEGFDDHARSFASGVREKNVLKTGSMCDGLLADTPGELTFAINKPLAAGGLVVSEKQVGEAVAFAFRELKLVVEPSGAVPLAALLAGAVDVRGKTVLAMVSGGNVDPETFSRLIA